METPARGYLQALSACGLHYFPKHTLFWKWGKNLQFDQWSPPCVTCRPRLPRGCGPRGRGGLLGPASASASSRRSGRPPADWPLIAREAGRSQQSRGSLWQALYIPSLKMSFCLTWDLCRTISVLIKVLISINTYQEGFCTVQFDGSKPDCWRCHAGIAQWSPEIGVINVTVLYLGVTPCTGQALSTSLESSLYSPGSQALGWWGYQLSPWRKGGHTDNMF